MWGNSCVQFAISITRWYRFRYWFILPLLRTYTSFVSYRHQTVLTLRGCSTVYTFTRGWIQRLFPYICKFFTFTYLPSYLFRLSFKSFFLWGIDILGSSWYQPPCTQYQINLLGEKESNLMLIICFFRTWANETRLTYWHRLLRNEESRCSPHLSEYTIVFQIFQSVL